MFKAPVSNHPLSRRLDGQRFGRLTALRAIYAKHLKASVHVVYLCRCDCGAEVERTKQRLVRSKDASCGCTRVGLGTRSDGDYRHPLFKRWEQLLGRCLNPQHAAFYNYGARGISVCSRWVDGEDGKTGFACFVADMGDLPMPRATIERRDNDGNYEPSNCEWADRATQNRNQRSNRLVTAFGKTAPVSVWALETGIPYCTLGCRIRRGWSHERAVTEPVRPLTKAA